MVGAMVFSLLSDMFGRKPAFLLACWGMVVVGVITSFVHDYYFFCVMRFLTGAFQQVSWNFIVCDNICTVLSGFIVRILLMWYESCPVFVIRDLNTEINYNISKDSIEETEKRKSFLRTKPIFIPNHKILQHKYFKRLLWTFVLVIVIKWQLCTLIRYRINSNIWL